MSPWRQSVLSTGHGERDAACLAAQRERGQCLVDARERIDVVRAETAEGVPRAYACGGVGFRFAREVDAAEVGEGAARRRLQLDDVVGDDEIHQPRPRMARPTIMRWISMVPDATVAACAYRQ